MSEIPKEDRVQYAYIQQMKLQQKINDRARKDDELLIQTPKGGESTLFDGAKSEHASTIHNVKVGRADQRKTNTMTTSNTAAN